MNTVAGGLGDAIPQATPSTLTTTSSIENTLPCPPSLIFAGVAIFFVLALSIVVPPAFGHDEAEHYFRVQQISNGQIFAVDSKYNQLINSVGEPAESIPGAFIGGLVAKDSYDLMANNFIHAYDDTKYQFPPRAPIVNNYDSSDNSVNNLNQTDEVDIAFTNTSIYSPLAYAPHIIGQLLAKAVTHDAYFRFLITRIIAGILLVLLFSLIIKLAPIGKWFLYVIGLFPTIIGTFASISSDSMNTIVIFGLIVQFLRFYYLEKSDLKRYDYPLLIIYTVAIGLIKYTLFPFILLIVALPICNKNYRNRNDLIRLLTPCLATFAIFFIWFKLTSGADIRGYYFSTSGGISAQLSHIVSYPLQFVGTLFHAIFLGSNSVFSTVIVDQPYRNLSMPILYTFWLIILLIIALRTMASGEVSVSPLPALVIRMSWLLIALEIIGTYIVLYLSFSPLWQSMIWGVQSRYFIVLLPLFLLIFYRPSSTTKATIAEHSEYQTLEPTISKSNSTLAHTGTHTGNLNLGRLLTLLVGTPIPLLIYLCLTIISIY